jgi:tetratricopeptide (TPR) repeat protein
LAQGRYDDAISYSSKLGAASKTAMNYFWLTAAYAGKGDKEKAFETLQQALKLGFGDFTTLDTSPYFKQLRDDPRYQKLTEQYRKK